MGPRHEAMQRDDLEDYDFTLHYHYGKENIVAMRSVGSHDEY